jgi:hypothetical protein
MFLVCIAALLSTQASKQFLQKTQQGATLYKFFLLFFLILKECFGRHTTHHQEPKTAQAASGFA